MQDAPLELLQRVSLRRAAQGGRWGHRLDAPLLEPRHGGRAFVRLAPTIGARTNQGARLVQLRPRVGGARRAGIQCPTNGPGAHPEKSPDALIGTAGANAKCEGRHLAAYADAIGGPSSACDGSSSWRGISRSRSWRMSRAKALYTFGGASRAGAAARALDGRAVGPDWPASRGPGLPGRGLSAGGSTIGCVSTFK